MWMISPVALLQRSIIDGGSGDTNSSCVQFGGTHPSGNRIEIDI
jgi:hypothetical protein